MSENRQLPPAFEKYLDALARRPVNDQLPPEEQVSDEKMQELIRRAAKEAAESEQAPTN